MHEKLNALTDRIVAHFCGPNPICPCAPDDLRLMIEHGLFESRALLAKMAFRIGIANAMQLALSRRPLLVVVGILTQATGARASLLIDAIEEVIHEGVPVRARCLAEQMKGSKPTEADCAGCPTMAVMLPVCDWFRDWNTTQHESHEPFASPIFSKEQAQA